jgi:hypothetical protein
MSTLLTLLDLNITLLKDVKLHFASGVGNNEPMDAFFNGTFKEWQEDQSGKNFEKPYIIAFISYKKHEWMFAGVYRSLSVRQSEKGGYTYKTELLDHGQEFIGRLIIHFEKTFRNSYPYPKTCFHLLTLTEILREPYTMAPFPGFENVSVSFNELNTIIEQQEPSWKSALSNVKGIYLITDSSNGKLYVGSASGRNAFWSRWSEYCKNGHGGNKLLRDIIKKQGIEHAHSFIFSILETRSMNSEDDSIISRESYWKKVLLTRIHGYNHN